MHPDSGSTGAPAPASDGRIRAQVTEEVTMRISIVLLAILPFARLGQNDPAPLPGWLPDLPSGFAESKKTGKPMMVVFR